MPEMDGLEATAAIRAREKYRGYHTPIIALTASVMPEDREKCVAVGMDGYVSKPISQKSLQQAIETCCALQYYEKHSFDHHAVVVRACSTNSA